MNKSWFYLGLIGLAILTTSCGDSKPPTPTATPATPAPAATVPPATPAKPVAAAPTTPAATAAKPADATKTVAVKPVSVDVAAGLIAPTDGESWAKTVAKGRPDPFGMLALQPVEIIEPIDRLAPIAPAKQQVIKVAPLANKQSAVKIATNNSAPAAKSIATKPSKSPAIKVASNNKIASNGKGQAVTISSIPRSGVNVALPKIIVALKEPVIAKSKTGAKSVSNNRIAARPVQKTTSKVAGANALPAKNQVAAKAERVTEKPLQAMALEISGVIEVEGITQVIIKLPTESFSRYIAVGDRIGNGKVLIKRVEGQNSLSPTIVLEEVGVEVPRKIGDISSAPTTPDPAPVATPVVAPVIAPVAAPATKTP
jgi:hypothetical protein